MSRNKIAIIFVLLTSSILVTDSMKLIDTIQMEANEISPMIKFVFKCVRSAEALISLLNKPNSAVKSDSRSIKNFSFDPLNPSVRGPNKTSSKNETDTTLLPEITTKLSEPDTTVEPEVEEDSKAPEDENAEDEAKAPEDENAEDEAEAPEDENAEDEAEAPEDENAEDEAEAPEAENDEDETEASEDENVDGKTEAPEDENAETETEVPSTTLSPE